MDLRNVVRQEVEPIDMRSYQYFTPGIPSLDTSKLDIRSFVGVERNDVRAPFEGHATLALFYKGCEAGVMSIREECQGEVWNILQVQGSKSKKSYRVSTGMAWHNALADRALQYALHPEAEVRRLAMPPSHSITNLVDAVSLENAKARYGMVRSRLGLQYSELEGLYVRDLERATREELARALLT